MTAHSDGEEHFAFLLRTCGRDIPEPARNYAFCEDRKWTFDFAWPEIELVDAITRRPMLVAVEIDGGNDVVRWSEKLQRHIAVGRHTQEQDYDKLNWAAALAAGASSALRRPCSSASPIALLTRCGGCWGFRFRLTRTAPASRRR